MPADQPALERREGRGGLLLQSRRRGGFLLRQGSAFGARRPGGGGGRGADGEVPRAGRSGARAAARALREGAARRTPYSGVFYLREERRGHRGAARHLREPRAERDRGQRAAVFEVVSGGSAGVRRGAS